MVFNVFPTFKILMLQDEVRLVCGPTFVKSKHDRVRRFIVKFLRFPPGLLRTKIFHICTTTLKSILEAILKLKHSGSIFETHRLIKVIHYGILPCLLTHKKTIAIVPFRKFSCILLAPKLS